MLFFLLTIFAIYVLLPASGTNSTSELLQTVVEVINDGQSLFTKTQPHDSHRIIPPVNLNIKLKTTRNEAVKDLEHERKGTIAMAAKFKYVNCLTE